MLAETTIQEFPWPMVPALFGFCIAFILQFRLRYHVDRDKVLQLQDMSELYAHGLPPRNILTPRGQQLYFWVYAGAGLFGAGVILTALIYSK